MKMISRTSTTSTRGVMLTSARICSMACFLWPDTRRGRTADGPPPAMLRPALFQDVVDELRRHVVHVDDELLHPRGEEVERHRRDDRDAETDRGRDQRLGDGGR